MEEEVTAPWIGGFIKAEPSADIRQMASFMVQMYNALVGEGMTEMQALTAVVQLLRPQA